MPENILNWACQTVRSRKTQALGMVREGFATRSLPADGVALRAYRGGRDGRLLTVAEVAEELAVCTATVYKVVARGELAAVRCSTRSGYAGTTRTVSAGR
jgi:excisionase family DNA binding protein